LRIKPGKFVLTRTALKTHYRADYTSEIGNVALARRSVAGFATACGFSQSDIADIRLAAGEALSNAVEHGSGMPSAGFTVDCSFDGVELRIEIQDNGTGFCAPEIRTTIEPDQRGRGFGIFLMRRLMDDVVFSGNGSIVRLIRRQRKH
jgi:serine/threonine-protein kinase RsbW